MPATPRLLVARIVKMYVHVRGVCVAHVAKRVNMTFAKKIIIVDKAPSAGERSGLLARSFKDVTINTGCNIGLKIVAKTNKGSLSGCSGLGIQRARSGKRSMTI